MQHLYENYTASKQLSRGGRVSSPRLRESIIQSQDFAGLEEGYKPLQLLKLLKQAGKQAGFTRKMIEVLEHYMLLTRESDWEEGSQPIVYKSLSATSMDLHMSERHLQRIEKQLFDAGAITYKDSGNHKRYGMRCKETGKIIYAFGVDLTPLAYMKAQLEDIVQEQALYKAAWMETKRQISWHRSQIKAVLAEMIEQNLEEGPAVAKAFADKHAAYESRYEAIAVRIRTGMSLEALRDILSQHQALYNDVLTALNTFYDVNKTNKESCRDDSNDAHKQNTNQNQFNKLNTRSSSRIGFQKSCSQSSEPETERAGHDESSESSKHPAIQAGLDQITGKMLLNAASQRFKDHIPMHEGQGITMNDIVEAAYALRRELHISQKTWVRACEHLTRYGAAVCVLLLDQAVSREENRVRKPAAYFNAMINRALAGELHLQKSVMSLLKRDEDKALNDDLDQKRKNEL